MAIDFNNDEYKQTTGKGPIPPDSYVILQMHIRTPKASKQGSHALLSRSEKGNEYLDCEFKVACGSYEGKTIWQNYTVSGSETASRISMRVLRAIIESCRSIDPDDASPQAAQGRMINDWDDFQGVQFMAQVEAKAEKAYNSDEVYVNNYIKKVVTSNMPEYAEVAQNGEIITDKPLPEKVITAGPKSQSATQWGTATITTATSPAAGTGGAANAANVGVITATTRVVAGANAGATGASTNNAVTKNAVPAWAVKK